MPYFRYGGEIVTFQDEENEINEDNENKKVIQKV